MKTTKSIVGYVGATAVGVVAGYAILGMFCRNDVRDGLARETCRIIGGLLTVADQYYGCHGEYPKLRDLRGRLFAPNDKETLSYLDAYGTLMQLTETSDRLMICSAGFDGVFGTSDDIVGEASRGECNSRLSVKGANLVFDDSQEWTFCEMEDPMTQFSGVVLGLRSVMLGTSEYGFWVDNLGDDACIKIPDMGIECAIEYQTDNGTKKIFRNGRDPFDTFKLMPLEGKSKNPNGNTSYYFEVPLPSDCVVPISARVRVYAFGFDTLRTIDDTESLRSHMIGEPITLTVNLYSLGNESTIVQHRP